MIGQHTLRERGGGDGGGDDPERGDEVVTTADSEESINCVACEAAVSSQRFVFSVHASTATQVFPNPYGQMKSIITVRNAWGIAPTGAPTTDFTWFAGYAWRAVFCAGCKAHLGWQFDSVIDGAEPTSFFGLLVAAIRQG